MHSLHQFGFFLSDVAYLMRKNVSNDFSKDMSCMDDRQKRIDKNALSDYLFEPCRNTKLNLHGKLPWKSGLDCSLY